MAHLTPFEKQQKIAENAHNEYQGRNAAIVYACVLLLLGFVLYNFDLGISSTVFKAIIDVALSAVDVLAALFGGTRAGVCVCLLIAFVLWIFFQQQMAGRAHNRYNFFGDHDHDPKH